MPQALLDSLGWFPTSLLATPSRMISDNQSHFLGELSLSYRSNPRAHFRDNDLGSRRTIPLRAPAFFVEKAVLGNPGKCRKILSYS